MIKLKNYFPVTTSKSLTRRQKETVKYLRSVNAKIERLKLNEEDIAFRQKYTEGKVVNSDTIPKWIDEINHKKVEKDLSLLAEKYGFTTKDEKDTLFYYLLQGLVIYTRTLSAWESNSEGTTINKIGIEEPKLIALKWDNFFRDKQIMEERRKGKKCLPLGKKYKLTEFSEDREVWKISNRFKKRLTPDIV